jgi:hypothetical protein
MWAHAFEFAAAFAVAPSVRAVCHLLLGRATLRVLGELASKALAKAANRDHVAEAFGSLIADVQARNRDSPAQVPLAVRIITRTPPRSQVPPARPGEFPAAGDKGRATAPGRR